MKLKNFVLIASIILASTLLKVAPVQAANFFVNTAGGLIAAMTTSNTNGEDDVIVLTDNISLTAALILGGPNGLPDIAEVGHTLTIIGNGFTISRAGGSPNFRIFSISGGGNLSLIDVTLSNGAAIGGSGSDLLGGGVFVGGGGQLSLTNSTISNSSAPWGGGIANEEGTVSLSNSTISGNTAAENGGGIYNVSFTVPASFTINSSTISDNSVSGTGQRHGGGIFNDGGTLSINNSTISGNSVTGGNNRGGGILSTKSGTTTINNSSIINNSADSIGGGLQTENGATTTLSNSIVAGNTSADATYFNCYDFGGIVPPAGIGGTFVTNANNLFGVNNNAGGCPNGANDIVPAAGVNLSDILSGLAYNGGPTQTHALVTTGPAIDAGICSVSADQRGADRGFNVGTLNTPETGDCDIGAFEYVDTLVFPSIGFDLATADYNETDGTVQIDLTITAGTNFAGSAEVYILDTLLVSATSGADYSAFPLTAVTIDCSSGCPTSDSVSFTISTDTLFEFDEDFVLEIVEGNGLASIVASTTHTGTILGGTATITLSATDPDAAEDPALADDGQFTVDLGETNGTGAPITVSYSLSVSSTAGSGADYTVLTGTVDILDNQQTAVIGVFPIDDLLVDPAETVIIALTGPATAPFSVDTTPATVTILDDESPGIVIVPSILGLRPGNSRTYDVSLTLEPSGDVTINLSQLDANCAISDTFLVFTDSAGGTPWNDPQTITVTAVGAAGSICTIVHSPSGGGYDTVAPRDVLVTIRPEIDEDDPLALGPEITVFDPAISKLGLLQVGQVGVQGEELEWVVTVSNTGAVVGQNVIVSDTLNPALQIDSVNAPGGTVTINGQTVTVVYPTLNVGQSVQFSIFTTVLQGAIVENTACVNAMNQGAEECATALPISELPSTGESPLWRTALVGLLAGLALAVIGLRFKLKVQS